MLGEMSLIVVMMCNEEILPTSSCVTALGLIKVRWLQLRQIVLYVEQERKFSPWRFSCQKYTY